MASSRPASPSGHHLGHHSRRRIISHPGMISSRCFDPLLMTSSSIGSGPLFTAMLICSSASPLRFYGIQPHMDIFTSVLILPYLGSLRAGPKAWLVSGTYDGTFYSSIHLLIYFLLFMNLCTSLCRRTGIRSYIRSI